jgi:hypothetical protein
MRTLGRRLNLVARAVGVEGRYWMLLVKDCEDTASRTGWSFDGIYIVCYNPVGMGCRELQFDDNVGVCLNSFDYQITLRHDQLQPTTA